MIRALFVCLLFLGSAPRAAAGDDGRLIVLNKAEASALVLQLPEGKVLAKLQTGAGPHEVAISPDARWAVIANYGQQQPGSSLTVVDLHSLKVASTLDLGKAIRPHGIVFARDGKSLWVTAEQVRELWQVSFPDGKVLGRHGTFQEASHMVSLGSGGHAFVANIGSGSVTRVDTTGESETVSLPTGAGAEGVAVAADGRHVWVSNRAAGTVSVVDGAEMKVVEQLECAGFPIRVYFTPKGDKALVTCATAGELAVFKSDGAELVGRVKMELSAADSGEGRLFGSQLGESPAPIGATVNADGTRVYVANANADKIAVVDLETMKVIRTIDTGKEPDGIAWVPSPAD